MTGMKMRTQWGARLSADHGGEALVAPQAIQQAPAAGPHERGGVLAPGPLKNLREAQSPQPLH